MFDLLPLIALATTGVAGDCAALRGEQGDVIVDAATMVIPAPDWTPPATAGPYRAAPVTTTLCRVEGRIEGNIGYELWLPVSWNGRLLGAGVGGDAGVFNYRDMAFRVHQGFATVTTDSGHKATQARWMANPKARVDYEHRASHLTAQAAKSIAARFYGRPVNRSYYLGCSGGGRQALKEMQNYPDDYDGVIAGAPGPYMPLQSVRMLWFGLEQEREPLARLTDADWALYERSAHAHCDAKDGVQDGVIENPATCDFDTKVLACKAGDGAECLSPEKQSMLDRIIAPMPDEAGQAMDWGLFPGVRTRPGPPSPLLRAMWADGVYDDPDWDAQSFQRSRDLAAANAAMPELRADKVAIAPFIARGNKAILYQGWQDPSTNAGPTIRYYGQLARAHGGVEALAQSVRLFMVPGMYHCAGGPGVDQFGGSGHAPGPIDPQSDILWALIDWVERGAAPDSVVATKRADGNVSFTRRLCAFPKSARYDGRGDAKRAESFACETAPELAALLDRE